MATKIQFYCAVCRLGFDFRSKLRRHCKSRKHLLLEGRQKRTTLLSSLDGPNHVESSCKDNIALSMSVEVREVGSQGDINDMECADSGAENVSHDESSDIEFDEDVDETYDWEGNYSNDE